MNTIGVKYTIFSGNLDYNEDVPPERVAQFAEMVSDRLKSMGYAPDVVVQDAEGCRPSPSFTGHDEAFNEDEALGDIDIEIGEVYSRWIRLN